MQKEQKIWIVARSPFPTRITVVHSTFELARAEAIRLARQERCRFIVFESVRAVEVNDIIETECVELDPRPLSYFFEPPF